MIRDIAFILAGYAAGSILFAKVFCSLLKKNRCCEKHKRQQPRNIKRFQKRGDSLRGADAYMRRHKRLFARFFLYEKRSDFSARARYSRSRYRTRFLCFQRLPRRKRDRNDIRLSFRTVSQSHPLRDIRGDVCFFLFYSENKSAFSQDARDIFFHGASNRYFCGEPDCLRGLFLHSRGSLHQVSDK